MCFILMAAEPFSPGQQNFSSKLQTNCKSTNLILVKGKSVDCAVSFPNTRNDSAKKTNLFFLELNFLTPIFDKSNQHALLVFLNNAVDPLRFQTISFVFRI